MKKHPPQSESITMECSEESSNLSLDEIDKKILNLLQDNNQLTNLDLAEKIGISPPPCLRRVKRMRELGIIVKDVCLIDPIKIEQIVIAFVNVTLEIKREDMLSYFERNMLEAPEVVQCYFISGEVDYLLVIHVKDMNHYDDFTRRVFVKDANIKMFRSNFCLSRVKYETKIHFLD
jgi:Lrp/AsnC family leucine-responsive transcriptional regulator